MSETFDPLDEFQPPVSPFATLTWLPWPPPVLTREYITDEAGFVILTEDRQLFLD
jgi:hypothetical protein